MPDQNVYAYNDANGNRGYLEADSIQSAGAWLSTVLYIPFDSVSYGSANYVANGRNAGVVPKGAPLPQWSPLVLVHQAEPVVPPVPVFVNGDTIYYLNADDGYGYPLLVLNDPQTGIPTLTLGAPVAGVIVNVNSVYYLNADNGHTYPLTVFNDPQTGLPTVAPGAPVAGALANGNLVYYFNMNSGQSCPLTVFNDPQTGLPTVAPGTPVTGALSDLTGNYNCTGNPNGQMYASVGAHCFSTDTQVDYTKGSGINTNTGWV